MKTSNFQINSKTNSKSFEAGVAEFYKETYLESPTFFNYFKSPKDKNFSESEFNN